MFFIFKNKCGERDEAELKKQRSPYLNPEGIADTKSGRNSFQSEGTERDEAELKKGGNYETRNH